MIVGTASIQINYPISSLKGFGSYCEAQLVNKVNFFCQNANRIDIVFNVYQENSLKNDTRESRGSGEGTRTLVQSGTPIQHKKFKDFLRVNNNKIELFKMIADVVSCKCEDGIVICTKDDKELANRKITGSNLEPCNHEEADTRLFVHAQDAALTNMQNVIIIGNDTDIVVIALYIFCDLKIEQL